MSVTARVASDISKPVGLKVTVISHVLPPARVVPQVVPVILNRFEGVITRLEMVSGGAELLVNCSVSLELPPAPEMNKLKVGVRLTERGTATAVGVAVGVGVSRTVAVGVGVGVGLIVGVGVGVRVCVGVGVAVGA